MRISGTGYPSNTNLQLEWTSANASWVIGGVTPQVTGISVVPFNEVIGQTTTNSVGSFSYQANVPAGFGGQHVIQAYFTNGTVLAPKAIYNLEPEFRVTPTSGPAGTPITITGTGMGDGLYSTNYHVYWDNNYVGYATAITTRGSTNFTIYASGAVGTHFLAIYQGYPGPGYLNAEQIPAASQSQSYYPPGCVVMVSCVIPYDVNFTINSAYAQPAVTRATSGPVPSGGSTAAIFAAIVLVTGGLYLSRQNPEKRSAITRMVVALSVVALVVVAGVVVYSAVALTSSPRTTTETKTQTLTETLNQTTTQTLTMTGTPTPTTGGFTPVATVDRPQIVLPVPNSISSGPRINVSPEMVFVGQNITVSGTGFGGGLQIPLTWTTRQGSNLQGYKLVQLPLRNVTTTSAGTFTFSMNVPPSIGGLHFIAAGNMTEASNGTVFVQRTGTISATQGPAGTKIVVSFTGVGWDYNTNIVTVDYDDSYVGYGCGFNTGGNVTMTIFAAGAPGVHNIDIYPSIWWGTSTPSSQQVVLYRYPILTPQDHPELMPSFHFTFLITASSSGG